MKLMFYLLLFSILVSIPLVYGQGFLLEFSEHSKFIKGESVDVVITGVDLDSITQITGVTLDNLGTQIESLVFDGQRFDDIGVQVWTRIETDNSKYQVDTLYTIKTKFQGIENQLQFTLSEPPLTLEELTVFADSQNSELEDLRTENKALREDISVLIQQIEDLNKRIDDLMLVIMEQINVMMTTLTNLTN